MNKISSSQLFTLLLGVKMFSLICSVQSSNAEQMAGAALSAAFQILAAIPMIALYRQNKFSLSKEILFGKAGKLLYALYFIIWGAVSFGNLWGVTKSVYFPIDSSLTGTVILAAVSIYAASLGLKSVSRYSTVMLGFIILSVAVMILGAYPKADLSNFVPQASASGILKHGIRDFCSSGELVMLFILLDSADGNREKSTYYLEACPDRNNLRYRNNCSGKNYEHCRISVFHCRSILSAVQYSACRFLIYDSIHYALRNDCNFTACAKLVPYKGSIPRTKIYRSNFRRFHGWAFSSYKNDVAEYFPRDGNPDYNSCRNNTAYHVYKEENRK